MTDSTMARRFADQHPGLQYDAILLAATVSGERVHGSIFLDQRGRFSDGEYVHTSSIVRAEHGGRVIVTSNTRYLVQMAAEAALISVPSPADVDLENRAYVIASKHVEHLDSLYGPARRAIIAAVKEALAA